LWSSGYDTAFTRQGPAVRFRPGPIKKKGEKMNYFTTDFIKGKEIIEVIGTVKGSSVRAKWFGADFLAGIRNIFGGEITEYAKLLEDTREQAIQRMLKEAKEMNANAVINVRFATSQIGQMAAEILAYGTAIKIK
jgi:uncharacterized protein YbjQ (UPF0145 family)